MSEDLELLFGKGKKQGLVAVESVPNKQNIAHVFKREGDEVTDEYIPYEPFIYLNSEDPVFDEIYDSSEVTIEKLFGSNYYDRRVSSPKFGFIMWLKDESESYDYALPQSQWMVQSEQTLFNGMNFDDPLRLYLDIEVLTKKGYEFPNSSREEDKIIMVSLLDNRGRSRILSIKEDEWGTTPKSRTSGKKIQLFENEKELLENFVTIMREWNPDIIVHFNGFKFDFPYIRDRCQHHGVSLAIGRDGSEPNTFSTSIKFGTRSEEYENYQIYGRHVIDAYFLAKQYDVHARDLPSYGLKQCVKYLGKASEDRTYIAGDRLADVWRNEDPEHDRSDMIRYALDDVKETQILDKEWGDTVFETTKMLPFPMQDVFRYGSGNKVESLFWRHYYHMSWSWPKSDPKGDFGGGFTEAFVTGLVEGPLIYADVSSMYPAIAEIKQIQPPKDELHLFQKLVQLIKTVRFEYKEKAQEYKEEGDDELHERFDASQNALKIILNTASYGYLGSPFSAFNNMELASLITETGREYIQRINKIAEKLGGMVCRTATDGTLFKVPEKWIFKEEQMVEEIERIFGVEGVKIDIDYKYKRAIIFDDLSYAAKKMDGTTKHVGGTIKNRSYETFVLNFMDECIETIFDKDNEKIKTIYEKYLNLIEGKFLSVEDIVKRMSLNKTIQEYLNDLKSNEHNNPQAQYELAIKADRPYQKGDTIKYYVSEPPLIEKKYKTVPNKWVRKKMAVYEKAKLASEYDNDLDREYYKGRLEKAVKKFLPILGEEKFKEMFPDISILKNDRDKLQKVKQIEDNE